MSGDAGFRDRALGCFLGACIGDAAGAVLEFMSRRPTEAQVQAALRMPGGGVWKVGPGQVTDDSEQALSLAHALVTAPHSASAALPLDSIATWYGCWMTSHPFDIGITTQKALATAGSALVRLSNSSGQEGPPPGSATSCAGLGAQVTAAAAQHNGSSLSNGCLMRITPLVLWGAHLPVEHLAAAAAADAALTHPNAIAQDAVAAYCLAAAHLLNHAGDVGGAVAAAQGWLQQRQSATVLEWLQEALQPGPGPAVHPQAGFMRWAFVHAFRSIHQRLSYEEALTQVLLLGGDTDTNATIVGGLVGALHGAAAIPPYMKGPVLGRREGSPGQQRPAWLQSGLVEQLTDALLAEAPRVNPCQQ